MKRESKFNLTALFMMLAFVMVPFLSSCGDDDDTPGATADKTEINALIAECETLLSQATTAAYPEANINTFRERVTAIKSAVASESITQAQVNNLLIQLQEAKTTFEQSAYDALPLDKMLLYWNFDEGEGNTLTSDGTEKWVAQLTKGPSEVFGADGAAPVFVDGVKGKALNFANGACLQVNEYRESALLSNELSIVLWVNPKEARAGNYLLSFNYWNNWKFNLQELNKPFFTVATTTATIDADDEGSGIPLNEWTQLAITLNLSKGEMIFYINGEVSKTWTKDTKGGLDGTQKEAYRTTSGAQLPFLIGCATTYTEAASWSWSTNPILPEAWDSFYGIMDEIRVFNTTLTQGQILKLYNDEKN